MWMNREKKPILYAMYEKRTFAFAGTHHGVGTTMISLNFSLYLSKFCKGKAALIEVVPNHDMERLEEEIDAGQYKETGKKKFNVNGLTVYKSTGLAEIPQILNENYQYFVFDLGFGQSIVINEMLRCYRKIVICNLAEWKRCEVERFLSEVREIKGYKEWEYVVNFSTEDVCRNFILDDSIKLKRMPLLKDYYSFDQEVMKLYHSFL